jgi:acetyl-CoA C-acetyltransferase
MGIGVVPAVTSLLKSVDMTVKDIDIFEINEAFAAQLVPSKEALGIDDEQLNPFGGAIALGHPFGMTGVRLVTTLLNGLETSGGRLGVAALCVAGGMGMSLMIERSDP